MPKAFDFNNPPFDRLTPSEAETLRATLDIAYFRPNEAIIDRDGLANALARKDGVAATLADLSFHSAHFPRRRIPSGHHDGTTPSMVTGRPTARSTRVTSSSRWAPISAPRFIATSAATAMRTNAVAASVPSRILTGRSTTEQAFERVARRRR